MKPGFGKKFEDLAVFRFAKSWLTLLTPLFMLSSLPVLTGWLKQHSELSSQDLILPLIFSLLTSIFIATIFYRAFNKNRFSALVGAVITTLIIGVNFNAHLNAVSPLSKAIISRIFHPPTHEGTLFSVIFIIGVIILMLFMSYATAKYTAIQKEVTTILTRIIIIIIAVAFIFQFLAIMRVLIIEWPQFFYRPPELTLNNLTTTKGKPDIYYIVFDRYTNQNVLKSQFDFNNTDFINFLTSNGFFVNPNAYSNYPYTSMSVASTLIADYHSDMVKKFGKASMQTQVPYFDTIRHSPVIETLKSLGYFYYHLGTWYEASNQAPLADYYFQPEGQLTVLGRTFTLNNFPKNAFFKSVYRRIVQHGLKIGSFTVFAESSIGGSDATLYQLGKLNSIADEKAGGRFIFAHILVPHDPYYFNADGSLSNNPDSDNTGKPIKQKYLGQVEFINGQIKNLISKIKKNSNGQAVIIIQADEGPYPMALNGQFNTNVIVDELSTGNMQQWSDNDLKMKYGILAAYYLPAAKKENFSAGGDSVNIFRLIFNTYLGANLPYLPKCYYAYKDGRGKSFNYVNITDRLIGQANPSCPSNSDFGNQ